MKNLYSRLGIDRGASAEEVQAALKNKPELGEYATILLHSDRREVYDSVHSTLKMIGALRLRLELDSSPSWFLKNCPDFAASQKLAKASTNTGTQTDAITAPDARPALQKPNRMPSKRRARSKHVAKRLAEWLVPAAIVIIGVIVIAMLLW